MNHDIKPIAAAVAAALLMSGCAVTPPYQAPAVTAPAAFKEAPGWAPAAPADALDKGPWWTLFGDRVLDELMRTVTVSNQNVAAAAAAYAQARALVAEQRAQMFPQVDLGANASRSGGGGTTRAAGQYRVNIGGTWEPDVWGKLSAATVGAQAGAQASAADLAAAALSAQGELAASYFALRAADAQGALLDATVAGYEQSLRIAGNRFAAGIGTHADVLQAQTQLDNVRIDRLTTARQRAQLEHAIAVLLGKAPAAFALAPLPADTGQAGGAAAVGPVVPRLPPVPAIPPGVPSELLQRRPDIAAAERRVAAANAQAGIARSAYFPSLTLSASYGFGASQAAGLFSASHSLWSLGLAAAQTLFDAGATRARVAGAEAARDAAVARYRQIVLAAFADVEDQLAASRILEQQQALRASASAAADQVEQQMVNRYRAGQVSYTEVVQAQATALSARRALLQVQSDRQGVAVALVQALGGGWRAAP
ncbi:efflux transporter outer membrane subunit [Pseudoduganella ginsengisoli]|uniref:Efflux transporter outer membrane subunit n=1 Tax=Pseudoduganella ginsengisoli TaxID=1462440 RepID=A0A6L6PXH4_9BURK|nr:efflux transporter outer membrane subunit [Pseudoduganella ginsengisoli]MTW02257.1 efflux transporter outer membrane subunit [Pseudoduganella ginsengisoli]